MKQSFIAALGAALILGIPAVPAFASSPDAAFARMAAQGGTAEVMEARLALGKSSNSMVDAFARRMLHDHIPNNQQLQAIMMREGIPIPRMVDPADQAMMARLHMQRGRAFDAAYLQGQVTAHEKMLSLLQNEVTSGSDPRLRAYARMTIPVIRMHLAMARRDVAMMSRM